MLSSSGNCPGQVVRVCMVQQSVLDRLPPTALFKERLILLFSCTRVYVCTCISLKKLEEDVRSPRAIGGFKSSYMGAGN